MLLNAARLFRILEDFLPKSQFDEMMEMVLVSPCKAGDESKVIGVEAGAPVVDFSVRRMFISRPGFNMRLWDLSQVELRGFAHFTGNNLLCGGYGSPLSEYQVDEELRYIRDIMAQVAGAHSMYGVDWERHVRMENSPFDAHQFVADELGIPRKGAKGINFGIIYGMGKKKLSRGLGLSLIHI